MSSSEKVARIRVTLKDIEPAIWRVVEVPLGMNLKGLNDTIQAVFGCPYVPDDMDVINLRLRLDAIARRRHDGKTAYSKTRFKS